MFPEALTFKDVLLTPRRSPISSRSQVDTSGRFTRKIKLKVPLVSANMDTVTESEMASEMARLGGLGIIHRFLSISEEVAEVAKVKRAESIIIEEPYTLGPSASVSEARSMMEEHSVGGLLVVDPSHKLLGIVTERDIRFEDNDSLSVSDVMTHKIITGTPGISESAARKLLAVNKLEKLPLIDKSGRLKGLVTAKDILKRQQHPNASTDSKGRLLVGAAIGVVGDYLERAEALIDAGADVLVLDVAHGHADHVLKAIRKLKKARRSMELVAGNVATFEGAKDLVAAGADGVKVGVGPGAICSTRIVTGSGVPQLTAILESAKITRLKGVPICADGGIRDSGDITKALAGGASSIMIGSLLAGTDESPGWSIVRGGMKYKVYRGMASLGATMGRRQKERSRNDQGDPSEVIPEGVESTVPYRGSAGEVIHQLAGGLRSGMSYSGAMDLKSFWKRAKFVRISSAGWTESQTVKGVV